MSRYLAAGDEEIVTPPRPRRNLAAALRRHRWLIAGPTFAIGLASLWVFRYIPLSYRSEAMVLVDQQKVPEEFVRSNIIAGLRDRLDRLTEQALSKTKLLQIVDRYKLVPAGSSARDSELMAERIRQNLEVEVVQPGGRQSEATAFKIRFTWRDPKVAQAVAKDITQLFVDENRDARTQQSIDTTEFLENQLKSADRDLKAQEAQVRTYKLQYVGELPEQLQSNLQLLSVLETQLRATSAAIDRAEQQRIYLESMQRQYRDFRSMTDNAVPGTVPAAASPLRGQLSGVETALIEAKRKLHYTRSVFTSKHPDINVLEKEVESLEQSKSEIEQRIAAENQQRAAGPAKSAALLPDGVASGIAETESRLQAIKVELDAATRDQVELKKKTQLMQDHIAQTPVREQQLAEVMRNYDNSKAQYQSLLQKKLQSELSTNLEIRQKGESFRVMDPPSLPLRPAKFNRLQIVLAGWAIGLGLGLFAAFAKELLDTRMYSSAEVSAADDIPVLTSIPRLYSPIEQRTLYAKRLGEMALAVILVLACAGSTLWQLT